MTAQTSPSSPPDDPRPGFTEALATAGKVIAEVQPADLRRPTPCSEFDVEALTRHVISIAQRAAAMGRGEPAESVPLDAPGIETGDWSAGWSAAVDDCEQLWSDSELLGRDVELPFGVMPGAVMLAIYTAEVLIHSWDLAVSINARPAWDTAIVETAYQTIKHGIPAEGRGPEMPFDAVVPTAVDAAAIDRLVAWVGRDPHWVATNG